MRFIHVIQQYSETRTILNVHILIASIVHRVDCLVRLHSQYTITNFRLFQFCSESFVTFDIKYNFRQHSGCWKSIWQPKL